MKPKFIFVIFLACLVAGAISYRSLSDVAPEKDIKASYLEGGGFTLQDASGDRMLSEFQGRPVVLYFGYTHCPDVCPLGLTVIRDALKEIPDYAELLTPLFVTLDPARDTAAHLKEYLTFFDTSFIGLTGSLEQLKELTSRYGTYFMNGKVDAQGNYTVDHTAYFYLINKSGELVRVLDHNTTPQALASELKKLL
jgi:protein SCO1